MEFWIATGSRIIEAAALIMAADSAQPAQIPYPAESAPVSLQAVGNASGTFVDLGMAGGEKAVTRSADGLFYLSAVVNGVVVRFLVDTGATIIVLTAADAARVGVLPGPDAFRYHAATAGGATAMARVRLASVAVGPAERRGVDAAITEASLSVSLLGQNWLSQMGSLTITGNSMVLRDVAVMAQSGTSAQAAQAPMQLTRKGNAEFDFRGRLPRGAATKKRLRIAPEPQYFLRA